MRLRSLLPAVAVFVSVFAALPAAAATGRAASFAAVRTEKAPALDASLTDPAWQKATVATGLQTVTTQKASAHQAQFLLLYDDANVYVGMKLEQTGAAVTASQSAN